MSRLTRRPVGEHCSRPFNPSPQFAGTSQAILPSSFARTAAGESGPRCQRAIEIVVQRSQAARLRGIVEEADVVLAPDLFVPEVVNTTWKYYRFEQWSLAVCDRAT